MNEQPVDGSVQGWIYLAIVAFLYFIPSFVAHGRERGGGPIVVNVFLGWTFIGWVAALAWACSLKPKERPPSQHKDGLMSRQAKDSFRLR